MTLCFKIFITCYRGRKIYEPPRYMSVNTCIEQLLEIEESRKEGGTNLLNYYFFKLLFLLHYYKSFIFLSLQYMDQIHPVSAWQEWVTQTK